MKKHHILTLVILCIALACHAQPTSLKKVVVVSTVHSFLVQPLLVLAAVQTQQVLKVEAIELSEKGAPSAAALQPVIEVVPDEHQPLLAIHLAQVPNGHYTLELIRQNGEAIALDHSTATPGEKLELDFAQHPTGTYYLRINMLEDRGFFRAFRVIKQ